MENITIALIKENSSYANMIKAEMQCVDEKEERQLESERRNAELKDLLEKLYNLRINKSDDELSDESLCHFYISEISENNFIKIKRIKFSSAFNSQFSEIEVDKKMDRNLLQFSSTVIIFTLVS